MDDLIEFWRKRLDEHEQIAKYAGEGDEGAWHQVDAERSPGRIETARGQVVTYDEGSPDNGQAGHIALNDPDAVRADIAADRKLLAEYLEFNGEYDYQCGLYRAITHRAARFSGHPEYREEWKP